MYKYPITRWLTCCGLGICLINFFLPYGLAYLKGNFRGQASVSLRKTLT